MYDFNYYDTLADGEEKMTYLKKCIAEADNEKDMEHALHLRFDYIEQSVFHGDGFKALIMFPEFLKLFDENPGIITPRDFMFAFKWIIDRTDEYYQISLEQIDEYFKRFREYIDQFGYTLRTYYKEQFSVYSCIDPDPQSMIDLMELSETFERTEMSDCETCEMSERVRCETEFGSFDKGMELLREMQERGMRCAEQPQATFGNVAHSLAKKGMYDEAKYYAASFLKAIKGDEMGYFKIIARVLSLYSACDLNKAYELFRSTAHLFSEVKTPRYRFMYADAARRFFEGIKKIGETELHTRLNSSFEWYSSEDIYNVNDMIEKFTSVAKELAEKFDERNHTDLFTKEMNFEYPDTPQLELKLPMHGRIEKDAYALIVPYRSLENMPGAKRFEQIMNDLDEFETVSVNYDKETGRLYAGGRTEDGHSVNYTILYDDIHELNHPEEVHYLGKDFAEEMSGFKYGMVIVTELADTFPDLRRLIKLANALNLDGSPCIQDAVNSRLLSSEWVRLEAQGTSAPLEKYFYRTMLFVSAFEEGKYDIITNGLGQSGSLNLIAKAVDEADIDRVTSFIRQIAINAVSVNPLPDEGIWFNAGIAYKDKEYLRVKWQPVRIPNDDGSVDDDAEVFAEPVIRFPDTTEYTIPEIPEEEQENIDLRQTNRLQFLREAKARSTFGEACGFLKRNADAFGMIAGAEFDAVDEDGEEYDEIIYVEVLPDGTCEVLSDDFEEEGKRKGDKYDLDPSRVFTWQLQVGEDGRFNPDDLYFLLTKEKEIDPE